MKYLPALTIPFSTRINRSLFDFDSVYQRFLPVVLLLGTISLGIVLAYVAVNISPALALIAVVAIPVGILFVVNPFLGLVLLIFLIPFENLNQGSVSVIKLLSVAIFGCATLHFLIYRPRDSLVSAKQNWLIFTFIIVVILSNFVAIDPTRTLDRTFRLLRVLALYFFLINLVQTEKQLKQVVWALLISGVLSTLYGFYAYYIDNSLLDQADLVRRMTGTMEDPNEFAGAMIMRLLLAWSLLSVVKQGLTRWAILIAIGLMLYGIMLTGSRGGLIALALAFLLFVLLQKNKLTWLIILSVIAVGGLIFMPVALKERVGLIEATGANLGNSTDRRETYQVFGLQLIQENPVLGIGFDGFAEAYARSEYRFLQTTQQKRIAHNTYLEIATGTGLIGLVVFLSILITSMSGAWTVARNHRESQPFLASVATGLFAGQGGYFLVMLFLSQQYEKTLWMLIGLVVSIQFLIKNAKFNNETSLLKQPASN